MQENNLHITFASRLEVEKWVDILIDAIERTMNTPVFTDHIIWHIASDGTHRDTIIALTEKYKNRIIYHGRLDQKSLADLYRSSDLLFMPSRFLETFGLTALESLACGTPVIGFRKGWLASFIPESFALHIASPIDSFMSILERFTIFSSSIDSPLPTLYTRSIWKQSLEKIIPKDTRVMILHDYRDLIGWAEYYVRDIEKSLDDRILSYSHCSYSGKTSIWKRRWMFIFSFFMLSRGKEIYQL